MFNPLTKIHCSVQTHVLKKTRVCQTCVSHNDVTLPCNIVKFLEKSKLIWDGALHLEKSKSCVAVDTDGCCFNVPKTANTLGSLLSLNFLSMLLAAKLSFDWSASLRFDHCCRFFDHHCRLFDHCRWTFGLYFICDMMNIRVTELIKDLTWKLMAQYNKTESLMNWNWIYTCKLRFQKKKYNLPRNILTDRQTLST